LCTAPGVTHYPNGTCFKGLSINIDVDFTPLPTIFHAMFFSFPLAFAPHLDTHAFCAEMTALRRFCHRQSVLESGTFQSKLASRSPLSTKPIFGVAGD
jgi:hypothetical protein